MKTIDIYISKEAVYNEVIKTAEYTGAKQATEALSFDAITISDAETEMLDRYWKESYTDVALRLNQWVKSVDAHSGIIELNVADGFNDALTDSLAQALESYFVVDLLSKWFAIAYPSLVEGVVIEATSHIKRAEEIIKQRQRPSR